MTMCTSSNRTEALDYETGIAAGETETANAFGVSNWVLATILLVLGFVFAIHNSRLSRKYYYGLRYKRESVSGKLYEDIQLLLSPNKSDMIQSSVEQMCKDNFNISLLLINIILFLILYLKVYGTLKAGGRMLLFLTLNGGGILFAFAFIIYKRNKGVNIDKRDKAVLNDNLVQVEANNIFQDFETPAMTMVTMGIMQLILTAFYCWGAMEVTFEDSMDRNTAMYYYLASFISAAYFVCNDFLWHTIHALKFWTWTMQAAKRRKGKVLYSTDESEQCLELSEFHLWTRFTFDVFVNLYAAILILIFIPLHVSTSDGSHGDFVLNVLAAFYINAIDDLKQTRRYRLRIEANVQKKMTDFFVLAVRGTQTHDNSQVPPDTSCTQQSTGHIQINVHDSPISSSHFTLPSSQAPPTKTSSNTQTCLTKYGGISAEFDGEDIPILPVCNEIRREAQDGNARWEDSTRDANFSSYRPHPTDDNVSTNESSKNLVRISEPKEFVERAEEHEQSDDIVVEPSERHVGEIWLERSSPPNIGIENDDAASNESTQTRTPKLSNKRLEEKTSINRTEYHRNHENGETSQALSEIT